MLRARSVLGTPFNVIGEGARVGHGVDDRLVHGLGLHLELVLHVQRAGGQKGVDPHPFRRPQRLGCPVDVLPPSPRKTADHGLLDDLGDFVNRFEIAVGGDGEAGLDHVDTHLLQNLRETHFLLEVHGGAR